MKLEDIFNSAVAQLQAKQIKFALAGGLSASLYRSDIRQTRDVDFIVAGDSIEQLVLKTTAIARDLGFEPVIGREAHFRGGKVRKSALAYSPPVVLVSRLPGDLTSLGLDFLFPSLRWVGPAVERAQNNLQTFGKVSIPCITPEDLIVAKLEAFSNNGTRLKDADDIANIMQNNPRLDLMRIGDAIKEYQITVSQLLKPALPKELQFLVSSGKERKRLKRVLGL